MRLGQPAPPVAENLRHTVPGGGMDSRRRHDVCDGGTRSRQGDWDGGRNSRMDVGSMTAMEARTLWLEREMGMLKRVMERETSLQRTLRSDYWRQEVRQDDQPLSRAHGLLEGDRASGQQGHHEGDRAVRQHGHHQGDRAFRQHGLPEGDRAVKQHGLLEGDRAFRQQGLPEEDRAVQQQGLSEGDRVRERRAEGEQRSKFHMYSSHLPLTRIHACRKLFPDVRKVSVRSAVCHA